MHEGNLITEYRLPDHTHMHSGIPALADLSLLQAFPESHWLKLGGGKGGKVSGMNGVMEVVGGWKSRQSNGIGLAFPPSAHTVTNTMFLSQEV